MSADTPPLAPKRRLAILARTIRVLFRSPQPRTFPALDGRLLPSTRGRLQVIRDANGVPHIYADHEADLYAALGYLQGVDRFVLLDIVRHFGAGRLGELIGNFSAPKNSAMFPSKGVADVDAFVRPLGFEAQSVHDYARLSSRARDCLDAFTAGVNAALRAMRGVYPPEYLLLGPIRPWQAADALLAARTCAFAIALSPLEVELTFDAVRGLLGDDGAKRFYPEAPWHNAPTTYANVPGTEPEPPLHLAAGGSNNWAVSGARSASGSPIFANDPHVPFLPLPTFWYHAHLECPHYRIQGGLMLGCPVFGFGHNGHLAWGVTTAYRDGWDLYRIHRLADDPTRYRTATGSGSITRHRDSRRTRLGKAIPLDWESCEHGIIYPGWKHHDGTDLALRPIPSDLARYFEGYLALAESRTVDEHRQALEQINDGPFDFNHIYAHKDGLIAWEPFGRLPRRRSDGLFVRDAHDPAAQWDGFVPFAEMPKMINPKLGFLASANSITDPQNFRVATTPVHVEPRHRQSRIESFLNASASHTVETFAALQRDVNADYTGPVRDRLVQLLASSSAQTELMVRALQVFKAWDGGFETDSAAAPLYVFTIQELARRVFSSLLGEALGRRYVSSRRGVPRLQRLLLDADDPLRSDVERASGRPLAALAAEAFAAATRRIAERYGEQPEHWRWGDIQRIRLATILGELPLIGRRFRALEAPFPGDQYTVSPSVPIPLGGTLRPFVGATSRFICDLSRPDEALFAHTSGPSGDVASAFFAGLTPGWYRFEYFRSALWKPDEVPNPVERVVIGG